MLDSGPLNVTSLTPSSFQLVLHPSASGQEIIGGGAFSNLTSADSTLPGNPPTIIYHLTRNDVSLPGTYRAWLVITDNSGNQETLSAGYIVIQSR